MRRLQPEHVRLSLVSLLFLRACLLNPSFNKVNYLSAMTSVAALQSWICMLITYLYWYRGAHIAIDDRRRFKNTEEAKFILDHRGFCQPYVSNLWMPFLDDQKADAR